MSNVENKNKESLLFDAVRCANETEVERFIECGADVNAVSLNGKTALFIAVLKENENIVKQLIKSGADINTALFVAVRLNEEKMVKKIIDREDGADVNATNEVGETPLFIAVLKENEKIVRKLIECGADVNAATVNGRTPLFIAVFKENGNIVEKLIKGGADVNATDEVCETPLFIAVRFDKGKMVTKLIKIGADVNATDKYGGTSLFGAVFKENERIVGKLIECGADVNATDKYGGTSLFYAVFKENERIVEQLIECGADVNATDENGSTALFGAVSLENGNIFEKLIVCGADVNATDKYGGTSLFYAVFRENEKIVEKLIECGADVNATDENGSTALFCAVSLENETIVEKLIECGADVNATDKYGGTSMFYAVFKENERIVEKLIECGADINTALFMAVLKENENIVEKLIECGADVNAFHKLGKTALFYAVLKENENIVEKIIERGADVNATDENGETPLFIAVRFDKEKMVKKLIKIGADVNATNKYGETPLFIAVRYENENIVEQLIECGADANAATVNGKTALFNAVWKENEKIVEKLIKSGADINTALFIAVRLNEEKMVKKLIECGADVNATNKVGETPLFFVNDHDENCSVARALIEDGGALLDVRDQYGRTPLFYAVTRQSLNLTRYLLHKGATDLCLTGNCSVVTFLIDQRYHSSTECLYNLEDRLNFLKKNTIVDKRTIFAAIVSVVFCNILHCIPSSWVVNLHVLSELLSVARDYTFMFDFKKRKVIKTFFKMMIKANDFKGLIEMVITNALLIQLHKLGVNPNNVDSNGNTALHYATQLAVHGVSQDKVIDICNQLKDLGASFHITNHELETPLLFCLSKTIEKVSRENSPWVGLKTQIAVCQFLLQNGSSIEKNTRNGKSVLLLTLELFQYGFSEYDDYWKKTVLDEAMKLLQIFIDTHREKNVSVSIQDNHGNTLLHFWAKFELEDYSNTNTEVSTFKGLLKAILQLFLEDKARVNAKNKNGETALHLCRTWTAVELLLDAGANPNDVDSSGCSPLLLAAKNNKSVNNLGLLYPDILLAHDRFWKIVLLKDIDIWTADSHGESVFSILLKPESCNLAIALVEAACDQNSPVRYHLLVMFSLLVAICKDKLATGHWKKDIAEKILHSTKCPVNGNDGENSPLDYCCKNIIETSKCLSIDDVKTTVHWSLAKLLRSYGADYRIPDETGLTCFEMSEQCPALKDLLMEPIDLGRFPAVEIKNWKSVSKTHERYLARVARHLESKHVESYWYHKDHLAKGLVLCLLCLPVSTRKMVER